MRFELETSWFPCKTLAGSYHIKRELKKALHDAASLQTMQGVGATSATSTSPSTGPDGYWKPIPISKHAFCCRLMKRKGTAKFDRPRTDSWYRSVLQDTFPEIAALPLLKGPPGADGQLVKNFFLDRCMNLRPGQLSKSESKQCCTRLLGKLWPALMLHLDEARAGAG